MTSPATPTVWTKAELRRLKDLHRTGLPLKEIAAVIGRSFMACQSQISAMRKAGIAIANRNSQPGAHRHDPIKADGDRVRASLACAAHGRDLEREGRRWDAQARP